MQVLNLKTSTMSPTVRNEHIDIAKGIAILCVMISHMYGGWVHKILFSFEIPIFFFISGFCLNLNRKTSETAFIRLKQLGFPFLLVAGILIFVRCFALFDKNCVSALTILHCLITTLKGHYHSESMGPFWFLPALWVATITVRGLYVMKHAPVYVCLASFIGAISIKHFTLPLSAQLGLASCIYLYAGCLCRQFNLLESIIFRDFLYICASFSFWLYGIYNYQVELSVPLSIQQAITSFAAFPAFIYISKTLTSSAPWVKKALLFLGKHTLLILGLHTLDITLCIHRHIPVDINIPFTRITLTCVLALVSSYLIKHFKTRWHRH